MKKLLITLTAFLIALSLHAQEWVLCEGGVKIKAVEMSKKGNDLVVKLIINIGNAPVESRQSLDIIPVLTDGTLSRDLPEVSIKGRRSYKEYVRYLALMGEKQRANYVAPYTVEKGYGRQERTLNYSYTMPFKEWMSDARLDIVCDLCGCGSSSPQTAVEQLIGQVSREKEVVLVPSQGSPHLAFIKPEIDETKRRDVKTEASLDFMVNQADIYPDYMNNPAELRKIREMIDEVKNNPYITVERIEITGYASPEGTLENNKRLSEERAKSLQDYLVIRYDFVKNLYHAGFGGENWTGLEKLVSESDMEYKKEVLDIIRSSESDAVRKKELMDLDAGRPYRYMVTNMFPKLRVATCRVTYSIRQFDVSEAKEMIKSRPQNLSLNEIYLVANTYPYGSEEFADVFETAVRMFPEDETANLNAAIAALTRNDIVLAERYLAKVKSTLPAPEYNNAMGVLELLKGNYERAGACFSAAEKAGLEEASRNLKEFIQKIKE
ncbi:DUF3868 domain-containing protein [uncultured Proteiniphilum sp.]|mgnify:CR=1 FL=1|uniref:DUF3868 domain-containing protein n=1 Tax=uncultured Proteiniphilum sp. TaxID=497637 RepID=UPI002634DF00|nr:DUF3868 domain-containing protein [uncultured Proteiniphilum sp.]